MRITSCGLALLALALAACSRSRSSDPDPQTGGDPKVGEHLIYAYGCGTCHIIPGVAEANRTVGPSLDGIGSRVYIAGFLVNTPENLVRWVAQPQEVDAETAMPDLGVTEAQARDIAAYLYTLR